MRVRETRRLRRIAVLSAIPMFALSVIFLLCIAVLVVLWVDVPTLTGNVHLASPMPVVLLEQLVLLVMACIWPVVVLEALFHFATRPWCGAMRRFHLFSLVFCACPALRMYARSPEMGQRMWLPALGWRKADERLQERLQRFFSVPMILIALMIMPVLIVEYFLKEQVAEHAWLRAMLHVGTGTIWFAFAAEFILMLSVAEKKWAYIRANWLDLAIILLPVVSFLRSLRVVRVTRLAQLARAQQLSKLARVYRLRGMAMKAFRALILLELFHRLFGVNPQRRLIRLRSELEEKQKEIARLRREIAELESLQAAHAQNHAGASATSVGSGSAACCNDPADLGIAAAAVTDSTGG